MYESRIKHLKEAHAALNKRIDGLESTGVFEDSNINSLKAERLYLRQQIEYLQHKQDCEEVQLRSVGS